MASPDKLTFTDDSFAADVLNSDNPVLVDLWAEWCPPCKAMGPTVDEVATEYPSKVKIGKLDVDSNELTAARYGVQSIPTLLLFKTGQVVEQRVGRIGKDEFSEDAGQGSLLTVADRPLRLNWRPLWLLW